MATLNSPSSSQASPSSTKSLCHAYLQVNFGLPLSETLYNNRLPCQLVEMLAYIAQEGVTTTDIFRQPGSTTDLLSIHSDLMAGRIVNFTEYNFYTLASLTKKFLLKIPGGLFGRDVESKLFDVLKLNSRLQKYEAINSIITKLPVATQQLLSLLLGTWFRIANHSEYNTMSSDAVAKSVALCLFHSVTSDTGRLQSSFQLLQILIDDFCVVNMLGCKNIQYFSEVTRTRVSVQEKRHSQTRLSTENQCCNELHSRSNSQRASLPQPPPTRAIVEICPPTPSPPLIQCSPQSSRHQVPSNWDQLKLNQQASLSAPDVNKTLASPSRDFLSSSSVNISASLSRFDDVKRRQMMRMKRRSHWFLSPNAFHVTSKHEIPPLMTTIKAKTAKRNSTLTTASEDLSGASFLDLELSWSSDGSHALPTSNELRFPFPVTRIEITSPSDNDRYHDDDSTHLPSPTIAISSSCQQFPGFAQVPESSIKNAIAGQVCCEKT